MPKQKTRKHLRGGVWPFTTYTSVPNNSLSPSHKNIAKTKLSYASLGEEATKIRAQQSQIATIVSTTAVGIAATSATSLAVGASLGIAGLVVPPVLPVMVAILVGIAFIMRQKGIK
jgi:primosomal replication protein N